MTLIIYTGSVRPLLTLKGSELYSHVSLLVNLLLAVTNRLNPLDNRSAKCFLPSGRVLNCQGKFPLLILGPREITLFLIRTGAKPRTVTLKIRFPFNLSVKVNSAIDC